MRPKKIRKMWDIFPNFVTGRNLVAFWEMYANKIYQHWDQENNPMCYQARRVVKVQTKSGSDPRSSVNYATLSRSVYFQLIWSYLLFVATLVSTIVQASWLRWSVEMPSSSTLTVQLPVKGKARVHVTATRTWWIKDTKIGEFTKMPMQ